MSQQHEVIEYAFGKKANLYSDVLSVPADAGPAQIQSAFFDRRYELYEVLSKEDELSPTERHVAERRMDAVVAAFRILSNPKLRSEYDEAIGGGGPGFGNGGNTSKSGGGAPTNINKPEKLKKSRSDYALRPSRSTNSRRSSRSSSKREQRGLRRSPSDTRRSSRSGTPTNSGILDDGEKRLQKQLLEASRGRPSSSAGGGLAAHIDRLSTPPRTLDTLDDSRTVSTISTMGMRGPTTPIRTKSNSTGQDKIKLQSSSETERTRPVESDCSDVYSSAGEEDRSDVSPIQRRRMLSSQSSSRHKSKSKSDHRSRRSRADTPTVATMESYVSESEESTILDDDRSVRRSSLRRTSSKRPSSSRGRSKKVIFDEVEVAGCSALKPMDFCIKPGRVFRACKQEIFGAAEDTTSAFEQVFTAFTLKGSEINAVIGEIDGAKKELSPKRSKSAMAGGKSSRRSGRFGSKASSSRRR